LFNLSRFDEAISAYKGALKLGEESEDGWLGLANAQRHSGDKAAAKSSYERVLKINSNHSEAKRELAGL